MDEFKGSSALSVQYFSITNVQNLGHQEPGILPFLCKKGLLLDAIFILLVFEFFNPFTMTEESKLLE